MNRAKDYRFHIDAYSPSTIPMASLAEYMTILANLFGYKSSVHFLALEEGSTTLVQRVDREDVPKVERRLQGVRANDASPDAMKAYNKLNKKLADDNAAGSLIDHEGAEIIYFPGKGKPQSPAYGPIKQQGSLDGVMYKIGGKDSKIPVHLLAEGESYACVTTKGLARQLSPHLFRYVRVHGNGRWSRDEEGNWIMERFDITDFELLKDDSLAETVRQLRAVEGSEWKAIKDPFAELQNIRAEPNEAH